MIAAIVSAGIKNKSKRFMRRWVDKVIMAKMPLTAML
jgi:hypothetical protein